MAEASLRLSEDSKQIALATSQDSALMRIIAILTLVYLPATFTAVSEMSSQTELSLIIPGAL